MKCRKKNTSGFSVFEILIVLLLFVLVIAVANQALFTSLRGQNKSQATTNVKQNGNYAVSVMERSLHSAQLLTSCTLTNISYQDQDGKQQSFSCSGNSVNFSGVSLTSSNVLVTCNFSCVQEGGSSTVNVSLDVSQNTTSTLAEDKSSANFSTRVRLRN